MTKRRKMKSWTFSKSKLKRTINSWAKATCMLLSKYSSTRYEVDSNIENKMPINSTMSMSSRRCYMTINWSSRIHNCQTFCTQIRWIYFKNKIYWKKRDFYHKTTVLVDSVIEVLDSTGSLWAERASICPS